MTDRVQIDYLLLILSVRTLVSRSEEEKIHQLVNLTYVRNLQIGISIQKIFDI